MTAKTLTSIWEVLLQKPSIKDDDDFFQLGGTPQIASRLFDEIARVFGREFSPTLIYSAPTVASLATVLDRSKTPSFPSTILLKAGTQTPPIFIAHGLGSSVMEFFELVRQIRAPHAIYGLCAKGSDGAQAPLTRIEAMAEFHLDAIRTVQARGPYVLIGYSLGGVIAFEMARQLAASGQKVAMLMMIDSYVRTNEPTLRQRLRLRRIQLRYRGLKLVQPLISGNKSLRLDDANRWVSNSDYIALERYRPSFYEGTVHFIRAVDSHYPDPATVWSKEAARLEVESVPGNHKSVLSLHSSDLARLLSRHLAEAQ